MSFVDSKSSVFKLDDSGGTLRTLTSYVDSVEGLPSGRELDDVTVFGDQGHRFIPSIANAQFTVNGNFDSTLTTGPHAVLSGLAVTGTATATFEYGPEGGSTGNAKLTGECWVTNYKIASKVGSKVSWTATCQVDGAVTVTVY